MSFVSTSGFRLSVWKISWSDGSHATPAHERKNLIKMFFFLWGLDFFKCTCTVAYFGLQTFFFCCFVLFCFVFAWSFLKVCTTCLRMAKALSRERSELYGREHDPEIVTYNDIYFQQKSLWPIFFLFPSRKLAELTRYRYSQNLGLTNKRHEVTRNDCQ